MSWAWARVSDPELWSAGDILDTAEDSAPIGRQRRPGRASFAPGRDGRSERSPRLVDRCRHGVDRGPGGGERVLHVGGLGLSGHDHLFKDCLVDFIDGRVGKDLDEGTLKRVDLVVIDLDRGLLIGADQFGGIRWDDDQDVGVAGRDPGSGRRLVVGHFGEGNAITEGVGEFLASALEAAPRRNHDDGLQDRGRGRKPDSENEKNQKRAEDQGEKKARLAQDLEKVLAEKRQRSNQATAAAGHATASERLLQPLVSLLTSSTKTSSKAGRYGSTDSISTSGLGRPGRHLRETPRRHRPQPAGPRGTRSGRPGPPRRFSQLVELGGQQRTGKTYIEDFASEGLPTQDPPGYRLRSAALPPEPRPDRSRRPRRRTAS